MLTFEELVDILKLGQQDTSQAVVQARSIFDHADLNSNGIIDYYLLTFKFERSNTSKLVNLYEKLNISTKGRVDVFELVKAAGLLDQSSIENALAYAKLLQPQD